MIATRWQAPRLGSAALLDFFSLAAATSPFPISPNAALVEVPHHWKRLGKCRVGHALDRDKIFVGARAGKFSALKLVVCKAPVHLHRVVVHFGNDQRMEVRLRKRIPSGGETRAVDLPGGRRLVRKVVLWHDTSVPAHGKAVVELWGRR